MITASPTAPVGIVHTLPSYDTTHFKVSNAAVLCRNNAPLVAHAFACIRRQVPVCILGRDLGAALTKIIKSWKLTDSTSWTCDASDCLDHWYAREESKAKKPAQRAALEDKFGCLLSVIKGSRDSADAIAQIDKLFTAASLPGTLVLSTGHKAKGQEWDQVFILDQHLIPSRYAATQADLFQERNVLYVMVTRSKNCLTYIKSGCWQN